MASTTVEERSISRPPTKLEKSSDFVFRGLTYVFAWATVLVVLFLVFRVGQQSLPAIKSHGLPFLYQAAWNPGKETYGILPQIWGTIYSSVLALIFGSLFGLAVAVFSERTVSLVVPLSRPILAWVAVSSILAGFARPVGSPVEESYRAAWRRFRAWSMGSGGFWCSFP